MKISDTSITRFAYILIEREIILKLKSFSYCHLVNMKNVTKCVKLLLTQHIQFSPFIMLCFGSIGMDGALHEPCCKVTILQSNYRKMTIPWSFSRNYFVKYYGKKNLEPQHALVTSKSML